MDVERAVQERYTAAATAPEPGLCCPVGYEMRYLDAIPAEVIDRDYGCGDPVSFVDHGQAVLDLGCGAGLACFVAAQIVGAQGRVVGLDFNDEMLRIARNAQPEVARRLGYANVAFRKGRIEDPDLHLGDPFDVVISNCVLNLLPAHGKRAAVAGIYRLLAPGGRAVVADIVTDRDVSTDLASDADLWSGCYTGALPEDRLLAAFASAGFADVKVHSRRERPSPNVDDVTFSSITVSAYRPAHPAAAVTRVDLFEDRGCHPGVVESLASFLKNRFGDRARVGTYDLGQPTGLVPIPPALFLKWQDVGSQCLPAMVVNSAVVTEGWLPSPDDAAAAIETGRAPAPRARPATVSCCEPGTCC